MRMRRRRSGSSRVRLAPRSPVTQPVIRVVGVGGAGTNAVNRMVEAEVEGVEFLAINTDLQSLQQSTADITLHIGAELDSWRSAPARIQTSAGRRRWTTTTASRPF